MTRTNDAEMLETKEEREGKRGERGKERRDREGEREEKNWNPLYEKVSVSPFIHFLFCVGISFSVFFLFLFRGGQPDAHC